MDEQIKIILKRRQKGALWGASLVVAVITYFALKTNVDLRVILASVILLVIPLLAIYVVNSLNYPVPSAGYRKFNKIFYIYASKIVMIGSIIEAVVSIKRFLNPLENFKAPSNPSKVKYLADAAVGGGTAYVMNRQAKQGEIVEQYYAQKEKPLKQ
ncbi:MAG TPA: hypothetical protein VFK11_02180 [Candidatus Saccharimonadales bacterium]|nr:hypothetical protein [Candidatus Saccharimonadales bacterium]